MTIKGKKIQVTECNKIFAKHIYNKGLVSKIFKTHKSIIGKLTQ